MGKTNKREHDTSNTKALDDKEEEFEDIVFIGEFKEVCPFCFNGVRVHEDGVIHALPTCRMFEQTECEEFIHRMRAKIKEIAERDRNVN